MHLEKSRLFKYNSLLVLKNLFSQNRTIQKAAFFIFSYKNPFLYFEITKKILIYYEYKNQIKLTPKSWYI